jgi:hypothetical protein
MRIATLLFVLLGSAAAAAAQDPAAPDGPTYLIRRLETSLAANDTAAITRLFAPTARQETVETFVAQTSRPSTTRAFVQERDRLALTGGPQGLGGMRLMVELFVEGDHQASIYTYRMDIVPVPGSAPPTLDEPGWRIQDDDLISAVEGLFKLRLNTTKQFAVTNLSITAEDFVLTVPSGSAFVSETPAGVTGLVVLGSGEMRFSPQPASERGQVRLFCGAEVLVASITSAFIRLNPDAFAARVSQSGLVPRPVDRREAAKAETIFNEEIGKSFALDLRELSRDSWSLIPNYGDFIAEVRTKKYDTLTYARSGSEAEDITVFDRKRRRNISVYASEHVRSSRGPTYHEDQLADYDILDYDIDASFAPARAWLEGTVRVKLQVRSYSLSTITMKLNEALALQSVVSERHGRLLAIRVKGQNSFIINLPELLSRDDVVTLRVSYGGRLPPSAPDREIVSMQDESAEAFLIKPTPRFVFSNRSYWYPQSSISDFATARMRLSVPVPFVSVASGSSAATNPRIEKSGREGELDRFVSEFVAGQPLRYLSWTISELVPVAQQVVRLSSREGSNGDAAEGDDAPAAVLPGVRYDSLDLTVVANPRQVRRGRAIVDPVAEILGFYAGLVDDLPYPTFTLAVVDNEVHGGHSPAYFALLYEPLPTTPYSWRNDPVYFSSFPQFFLAHELAHQYWGQAVGWKSYHEQWISEGFAQYFAALYAERRGASTVFRDVLRRMARSVFANEDQGPIVLGYRLGHIRGDSRAFRAVIYNKSALVLHMLRRLVGDEVFFDALRRLYQSSRFTKIGTDDVQALFEETSGKPLGAFFERWFYQSALPRIKWSWRVETPSADAVTDRGRSAPGGSAPIGAAVVHFDQGSPAEEAFSLPVTVTLTYADGSTQDVVVNLLEPVVDARIPLEKGLKSVDVNTDAAALARFERQ